MTVPTLVPLELRQLRAETDTCTDERCLTCGLLGKLLRIIDEQAEELTDLRRHLHQARIAIADLEEQLAEDAGPVHTYLPWSSAYQPLAS